MKIQVGELRLMIIALKDVMGEKLPIKTAFKLNKLAKKLFDEHSSFEETRMILVNEFANRDGNGPQEKDGEYIFESDNREKFNLRYNELAECDIDIDFEPIPTQDLGDIKISPINLDILSKFIKE